MCAVSRVEAQPLGQRQIPEPRVLDEQVPLPGGQQLALECEEPSEAFPELAFDRRAVGPLRRTDGGWRLEGLRSEEHTSELQSHSDLVCRLLLEKKKKQKETTTTEIRTEE